jgi:multisubunit Na+/H+ antiporter MnhB subunit
MPDLTFTSILAIITGIVLIALLLIVYVRSRQGDQRIINVTNQMLFFMLSAILVTLGIAFANHRATSVCSQLFVAIRYATGALLLLLTVIGVIRYITSVSRDKRLITHPVIFGIIIAVVAFLVEYLNGCL